MKQLVMVHINLNNTGHLMYNDKSIQHNIINFFVVHLSQDITKKVEPDELMRPQNPYKNVRDSDEEYSEKTDYL